jgi:broad specificity phosphatase PhoE
MKIVLVRHGHVEGISPERFRGREDLPLTSLGRKQASATAERVASSFRPVAIYSSPLRRALETANPIAKLCSVPVQPMDAFCDIDYGDWQGLTPQEVAQRWPDELALWYRRPQLVSLPHGESLPDVFARMAGGLYPLLRKHADDTVVILGHDCLNRVMLLHALELPQRAYWRIGQDPCALNEIQHSESERFFVHSLNDAYHVGHLRDS